MPLPATWRRLTSICALRPREERMLQLLCSGHDMRWIAEYLYLPEREVNALIGLGQMRCRRAQPWMYVTDRGLWRSVVSDMILNAGDILREIRNSNMQRRYSRPGEGELTPIRLATVADIVEHWVYCLTGGYEEPRRSVPGRVIYEIERRRYALS